MSGWRHLCEEVSPFLLQTKYLTLMHKWHSPDTLLCTVASSFPTPIHVESELAVSYQKSAVNSQQRQNSDRNVLAECSLCVRWRGRSTAASKVNAFVWYHYPIHTIKLNKNFLANKCLKLWNIYTASAECLKRRGEKWYFFIDVGDIVVCLSYSGILFILKLFNLKCYFIPWETMCQFIFEFMNKVKWLAVNLIRNNIKVFLCYKTVTWASLLIGICFQTVNLKTAWWMHLN